MPADKNGDAMFGEGTFDPPPAGDVQFLPPDVFGDSEAPLPIAGSPIRFYPLLPQTTSSREIEHGISLDFTLGSGLSPSLLHVVGEAGSVAEGADVRLVGIDDQVDHQVTADATGPKHLALKLTRSKFEQLTADLVERCLEPVQQAMSDAKLTADDLDVRVDGTQRDVRLQRLSASDLELAVVLDTTLGADALAVTGASLFTAARRRTVAIKSLLLDQAVIAGVGNIYADEALYRARIHPLRPANRLNRGQVAGLHDAVISALEAGVAAKGASIDDFRHPDGVQGSFQDRFLVHLREGEPCPDCGRTVRKLRRIGKRIAIGLDGDLWLVLHLMIVGRLQWREPGAPLPRKLAHGAFDFAHGRLDTSLHPFCGGTPEDLRITTPYDEGDFTRPAMSAASPSVRSDACFPKNPSAAASTPCRQ